MFSIKMLWRRGAFSTLIFISICLTLLIIYNEIATANVKLRSHHAAAHKRPARHMAHGKHPASPAAGHGSLAGHGKHKGNLTKGHREPRKHILPTVIIIGTPKGGTDALRLFMNHHPRLKAPLKDINFFSDYFSKGVDYYINQTAAIKEVQISFESSSKYFVDPNAPSRMRRTMPKELQLILLVRDPVERLKSDYARRKKSFPKAPERSKSLDELVMDEVEGVPNLNYEPVKWSNYDIHLERWLKIGWSKEQFIILDGEEFLRTPWTVLKKVENQLGLSHRLTKELFVKSNETKLWCIAGTPPLCTGDRISAKKAKIKPATDMALVKHFKAHMERFYKLSDHTFDWKNYKD